MTRRRGRARAISAAFAILACLSLSRYRDPRPRNDWYRARSSAGEHYLDMVGVTGSIPVAPTSLRELRLGEPAQQSLSEASEGCHAVALRAKAGRFDAGSMA